MKRRTKATSDQRVTEAKGDQTGDQKRKKNREYYEANREKIKLRNKLAKRRMRATETAEQREKRLARKRQKQNAYKEKRDRILKPIAGKIPTPDEIWGIGGLAEQIRDTWDEETLRIRLRSDWQPAAVYVKGHQYNSTGATRQITADMRYHGKWGF
jgi:hypothetical protein